MTTRGDRERPPGLRDSAEPDISPSLYDRLATFSIIDRGGRAGAWWPWRLYRARRKHAAWALAVISWLPMALIVVFGLRSERAIMAFARDYAVHVRALFALPALVIVEPIVDRRIRSAVRQLVESQHVVPSQRRDYERLLERIAWLRDTPVVPAAIVALATFGSVFSATHSLARPDLEWSTTFASDGLRLNFAGWWLVAVSVPLFEMLALLWVWRWLLWTVFVWRVARLRLHLIATHPDKSAGLVFLSVASSSFAFVVLAAGSILDAAWIERMVRDHVPLERFITLIIAYAILSILIVFVPVLGLVIRLRQAHHEGIERYGVLVGRYIARFDRKWAATNAPHDEPALAALDAQNMADLGIVFERIESMRFIPIAPMVLRDLTVGIVLPMLPLLLAAMSPKEILQKIVEALL